MADHSTIEWTNATWNPITGCSVVSPGCTNCYAMKLAGTRLKHHPSRSGLTTMSKAGPVWNGEVRFNAQWLDQPLRWTKPRIIFVCAHGDLFHESVPDEWIDKIFAVMALCPQHTFQVLTKRAKRMREYLSCIVDCFHASPEEMDRRFGQLCVDLTASPCAAGAFEDIDWPLPNVWAGVSCEDQPAADERIPELLATPAAVRWVSAEPLLGPIDFGKIQWIDGDCEMRADALTAEAWVENSDSASAYVNEADGVTHLDWIVAGGESGPGARPMHPDWPRAIRDQCAATGVAFFFKQWGEFLPVVEDTDDYGKIVIAPDDGSDEDRLHDKGPWQLHRFAGGQTMGRLGKRRAGRHLDGRLHNAMPAVR